MTLVSANVTLRGVAGFDLAWSLEVTAFLLLWTTFLGCAAAMARGKRMLQIGIDLIIVVLLLTLIVRGLAISEHTWRQRTTVLYWPVGQRIIVFSRDLLGFMPGGLGMVVVGASMLFGGISGSAIADSAAIGSVMIKNMAKQGYKLSFAAGLVAAAGNIGIIIPPSIPMLIYGFVGNVSVAELFLYELYEDRAAFELHLASPHFRVFDRTVATMVVDKQVKAYGEVWQ